MRRIPAPVLQFSAPRRYTFIPGCLGKLGGIGKKKKKLELMETPYLGGRARGWWDP